MDPKMMMQVPNAVRELAEKSVEQAKKAFEAFMSAASKSVAMVPSPATGMSKNTMTLADKNMKAAFDHARKLIHAKDVKKLRNFKRTF